MSTPPVPVAPAPELAERIAAAVLAHPDVAGLHGGIFGVIATLRPGRRLMGVRLGEGGEPVELGVVLRLDRPIPAVVADLRATVSRLCGGAAVDITVADITADITAEATAGGTVVDVEDAAPATAVLPVRRS